MYWIIVIVLILTILFYSSSLEHLMVPGVQNRDETIATFADDRSWFENGERNFYSRYTT